MVKGIYLLLSLLCAWGVQWLFSAPWYGAIVGGAMFAALFTGAGLVLSGAVACVWDAWRFALTGIDRETQGQMRLAEAVKEADKVLKRVG